MKTCRVCYLFKPTIAQLIKVNNQDAIVTGLFPQTKEFSFVYLKDFK